MEDLDLVVPKDDFSRLANGYNILFKGVMEIDGLETPQPVRTAEYSLKTEYLDVGSVVEQLERNTRMLAGQLRLYFERIANEDEGFMPYWTGEKEFRDTYNGLPDIRKRGTFESQKRYLKDMDLEGRISLDKHLHHFDPFFEKHDLGDVEELSEELRSEFSRYHVLTALKYSPAGLLVGGMGGLFVGGFPGLRIPEAIFGTILFGLLGGAATFVYFCRSDSRTERNKFKHGMTLLYERAKTADYVLFLIKKHSNFAVYTTKAL
jgi:hypothetical protein